MCGKKKLCVIMFVLAIFSYCARGQQTNPSLYLFHLNPFQQVKPMINTNKRTCKLRLDFGLVFGFYGNDPHYTNTTQSQGGFTFGAREEIPVLHKASIMLGADFYQEGFTFNSYFFAKGYSLLYIPSEEIYNHTISIQEVHFPVEYKFSFSPETKNVRTFYGMFGWVYRLLIYDNALVINTNNSKFVYEGQDNLIYKYSLFSNYGSSCIELGLGYQRNGLKNGRAFFLEFDYRYGISPLIYTGNNLGSNYVTFTLDTFTIKVGIKI